MQDRINKKRFVLLATLTAATLLAWWWVQPENRIGIDDDVFRVGNLQEIDRVVLRSDKEEVVLSFDGARWRVNDTYTADGGMIRVLFATLQQALPKRAVAGAGKDSVFQTLRDTGVRVALYEGDALQKEFYAGGNREKTQAMFADPVSEDVYVMTIPGYRVYVSGILELDANGWRDKFVFGFNWQNFKSMEARFPEDPSANFTVALQRNTFGIEGMDADTARLHTFLDDVSLLTVEAYLSEPKLTDSLSRTEPTVDLVVTDIGNRNYRLRLFDPGKSSEGYGLIQDSQIAVFSRRKIQSLLKPKSFFRKK